MNRRTLLGHLCTTALGLCLLSGATYAQTATAPKKPSQTAESGYSFDNDNPAYEAAKGPLIRIHRYVSPYVQRGAFEPFRTLVETDGFRVEWLDKQVSPDLLGETDILVIANAYTRGGANDFQNFTTLDAPSVYSPEEIAMIVDFVKAGGSLLILADHSPFAGGTIKLAEALGFVFMTGIALHNRSLSEEILGNIDFRREGEGMLVGKLSAHPIVDGALGRKTISHYYAFEGQAIIPPPEATTLLTIPENFETMLTFAVRRDFYSAPRLDASGLSQGSVLELGKGRVAVFGETGGFTSQSQDGRPPFGLSSPLADENAEFVLSTMRWLAGYQPK